MILRPLSPAGDPIDTTAPDARARIAELYPAPGLRVKLVATLEGGTSDAAGNAAS